MTSPGRSVFSFPALPTKPEDCPAWAARFTSTMIIHLRDLARLAVSGAAASTSGATFDTALIGAAFAFAEVGGGSVDDIIPGPPGPPGGTGATGLTGIPGPAIFLDAQSIEGEPGAPGLQGPTGAQGALGPPVFLDAESIEGEPGVPGLQGPTGAQGATGPPVYLDADPGVDGDPGAPGIAPLPPQIALGTVNVGNSAIVDGQYLFQFQRLTLTSTNRFAASGASTAILTDFGFFRANYVGTPRRRLSFNLASGTFYDLYGRLTLESANRATLEGDATLLLTDDFSSRNRLVLSGGGGN